MKALLEQHYGNAKALVFVNEEKFEKILSGKGGMKMALQEAFQKIKCSSCVLGKQRNSEVQEVKHKGKKNQKRKKENKRG